MFSECIENAPSCPHRCPLYHTHGTFSSTLAARDFISKDLQIGFDAMTLSTDELCGLDNPTRFENQSRTDPQPFFFFLLSSRQRTVSSNEWDSCPGMWWWSSSWNCWRSIEYLPTRGARLCSIYANRRRRSRWPTWTSSNQFRCMVFILCRVCCVELLATNNVHNAQHQHQHCIESSMHGWSRSERMEEKLSVRVLRCTWWHSLRTQIVWKAPYQSIFLVVVLVVVWNALLRSSE